MYDKSIVVLAKRYFAVLKYLHKVRTMASAMYSEYLDEYYDDFSKGE